MTRKRFIWKLREREVTLGDRTLIVGILNVTPDSFSDGGGYEDPDRAYVRAVEMEEQGADIIDIGAESTRPNSQRVPEAEELRRLVPVLKRLRGNLGIPISVDTYKSAVAEKALTYGAEIINDPSALTFDPGLAKVATKYDSGLILNHMRGTPETWAKLPPLKDPMTAIAGDLGACVHRAIQAGVDKQRIIIDPGLGFGKRKDENWEILARLHQLQRLEFPILIGASRKSFLQQNTDAETLLAGSAAVTAAILGGAHMVRVHDVKETVIVAKAADAVLRNAVQGM
ncbi:MAG: dihydropteroate synthase [Acidobacteria bacterium]|nr:dihydropteroate synthase [Acidobacteriota bacterium]